MKRAVNLTEKSVTRKYRKKNNIFDISSAIARVASKILKALTTPSATNVKRSAVELEDLKKGHIARGK